ncbi:TCEA3 protein, partial [Eudromia elegans]|nr:TCEA3 protein [Eudromia elegans]
MGPAEELVRIAKKLDKMVARKSTEGALDLLKSLTGYTMTIQLLQTTRIGVAVNSVRKHCSDEEVVASAKILIKNWKRLLGEDAGALGARGCGSSRSPHPALSPRSCSRTPPATSKTSPPHGKKERWVLGGAQGPTRFPGASRGSGPIGKLIQCVTLPPGANSSKGSPSSSPAAACLLSRCYLTGDPVRDKCVEMLAAALRMDDDYKEFGVNCEKMAAEIEEHILWDATDMKYRNRVRSRISNLKDPKNPNLRRNVLCGAIAPGLIARMTAEEMASDELKELRNAMTQEAIREHQMAKTGGTVTDLFQCGKCKKKNCTYNQVQTRSADEPMTTFVLCNECGNRWKVG